MGLVLVLPTSARAETVALLPLDAPGLLPAARDSLEADLRVQLVQRIPSLQAAESTSRSIAEAIASGLDCSLVEEDCAARAGIAAGVDRVGLARVDRVDDRLVLSLVIVDVSAQNPPLRMAGVVAPAKKDGGESLRRVVTRLLDGVDAAPATELPIDLRLVPDKATLVVDDIAQSGTRIWLTPGEHKLVATADGFQPVERTVAVRPDGRNPPIAINLRRSSSPIFNAGVVLLASGVGVAALAGAGVGLSEAMLYPEWGFPPLDADQKVQLANVGLGLMVIAAVGTAVAVAGGVVTAVGAVE